MRTWLRSLFQRRRVEADMDAELRFHMEAYADDLVKSGVPRKEAVRRARLEFGVMETAKEECRRALGLRLADEFVQDLRFGWRTLRGHPGFTAAAVVSIALGIGANTAVFTMVDAVLLRSLPVKAPQELYFFGHGPKLDMSGNYPMFAMYKTYTRSFSGVTAIDPDNLKVRTGDRVEVVPGQFVSGNYFDMLGIAAARGRVFLGLNDRDFGHDPVVVISDRYWDRAFGRAPDAIGRTMLVNEVPLTVIGITAREYRGFVPGYPQDLTVPYSMKPSLRPGTRGEFDETDRLSNMMIVGRLKPGVPLAQARAESDVLFQRVMQNPGMAWTREHMLESFQHGELTPAERGSDGLRKDYGRAIAVLMAMVGLLLLVACGNVANLLLARASARAKEVAVRLSIGAGRLRIVRQFLTESLLLAALGGAAGVVLALWATRSLASFFATGQYPIELDFALNTRILAFTVAATFVTGLLFGLAPAIRAARLGGLAMEVRRTVTLPRLLVVSQMALCVVLLAAGGLLVRTLRNLKTQNAGFDREGILLMQIDPGKTMPARFYEDTLERLNRYPTVLSAAASWSTPAGWGMSMWAISVPGYTPPDKDGLMRSWVNLITPGYFTTFGMRLLQGRHFTPYDGPDSTRVAVINDRLARTCFGSAASAIGKRFYTAADKNHTKPLEIVGVVSDTRQRGLREEPPMMFYMPLAQQTEGPSRASLAIRASGDPQTLARAVREDIRAVHPGALVSYVRTMDQQVDDALFRERLLTSLSTIFGALALTLACVGLYGVMSYAVTRRTREIGIRVAVGAQPANVMWLVLRDTLAMGVAGAALGIPLALGATRWLNSFLFGLKPDDPVTLAAVLALLLTVVLLAGWGPARSAMAIEPVRALRHE